MHPATSQDLSHAIKGCLHYGRQAFMEQVKTAVRLGKLLLEGPFSEVDLEEMQIDQDHATFYRQAAERWHDCETWDDMCWEAVEGQWLSALATWTRALDKSLPPRKRERARRQLRGDLMIARFAFLSLRQLEGMKGGGQ